jgi:hypothetical protein
MSCRPHLQYKCFHWGTGTHSPLGSDAPYLTKILQYIHIEFESYSFEEGQWFLFGSERNIIFFVNYALEYADLFRIGFGMLEMYTPIWRNQYVRLGFGSTFARQKIN